jgi:hypothetical protein
MGAAEGGDLLSSCGVLSTWRLITKHGTRVVAFDAPGRDLVKNGEDPESAVSALVPGLLAGTQAALLLEAPMSVPVPVGPGRLPRHRCTWAR